MKKQLNVICFLIFLSFALSLIPHLVTMGEGFVDGFKAGWKSAENSKKLGIQKEQSYPLALSLRPKDYSTPPDSVYNVKSGTMLPAHHYKTMVWKKGDRFLEDTFLGGIISLFYIITVLWAIFCFYKLINAINHQIIFEWQNVKRLKRMGILLLIAALMSFALSLLNYFDAKSQIELAGYEMDIWTAVDNLLLVLGLVSLLVGRIFAMGITLQEEQDLTI